jgi:hypothetical protein
MSGQSAWRTFVERRRRELHGEFPCSSPTDRHVCPKHGIRVPQTVELPEGFVRLSDGWRHVDAQTIQLSGICKPCRDELYAQLAAEFTHDAAKRAA